MPRARVVIVEDNRLFRETLELLLALRDEIEVVAGVGTGAVTIASRDVETNGVAIRKGEWLGLADGLPVAGGGSFDDVARAVAALLLERPRGILTLLTGEEPQPIDALVAEIAAAHAELELDVREGGQPSYPLLLGAE